MAVAATPFALLFGVLAVQQGMTVFEATLMSTTLFAGASQMVGIELFGQPIPAWVIVFSIFAVNFRHVLYSAAIGRQISHWSKTEQAIGFFFLTDLQYAGVESRAEQGLSTSFAWYMGLATPIYVLWVVLSALGAAFGNFLPDTHALGFDYLLPIYFLGLVIGFRKRPLWLPIVLASGVASVIAYKYVGSPWHVSLGAAVGIALAAIMAPAGEQPSGDPPVEDIGGGP
jgi:predicted branched-subunit amino acid permease